MILEDLLEEYFQPEAQVPNPIGLTIVKIKKIKENAIFVIGLDALPGSPIIDIKPTKENEIEKI